MWWVFLLLHLFYSQVSGGQQFCQESTDCLMRVGTTCQNSECICSQTSDSPYPRPCPTGLSYGEKCSTDSECGNDLVCDKSDLRICRCRRGRVWDIVSKRCYMIDDDTAFVSKRYDLTRDVIIPSVILATLAITGSLCYRLFCKRKSWRRSERRRDMARALEEAQLPIVGGPQPTTTWIASYRVVGAVERTAGPPCLLVPLGPPPYEEALKHKVLLSSFQPPPTTPL